MPSTGIAANLSAMDDHANCLFLSLAVPHLQNGFIRLAGFDQVLCERAAS